MKNNIDFNSLKKKYKRSIIKLGNSKAITFPQEWTNLAKLTEKAEITMYPIDSKTMLIRALDKEEEQKITYELDGTLWPAKLIKQAIMSAFKLNIDSINLKYNEKNREDLYSLLFDLQGEIIGLEFKEQKELTNFHISFLLDLKKKSLKQVILDLIDVFEMIIENIIAGQSSKNSAKILAKIDRQYSLGTRILITGLSEYPYSRSSHSPLIRYLGDRVILLYIRDFINEGLNLHGIEKTSVKKYAGLLLEIPKLLKEIILNFDDITLKKISIFQEELNRLNVTLDAIKDEKDQIRILLNNFLNGFKTFFDIGITRMIETEIGLA